jgi:hypothetical protein
MRKSLELFKIESNGVPLWLAAVDTLEEARQRAKLEHQHHPDSGCHYRVLDPKRDTTHLIPLSEIEE